MILAVRLPPIVTARHVRALVEWVEKRAPKLRPWLETYAAAEAAKEGVIVGEGAVPEVFAYVLHCLGHLMAWPDDHVSAAVEIAAHEWFESEAANG